MRCITALLIISGLACTVLAQDKPATQPATPPTTPAPAAAAPVTPPAPKGIPVPDMPALNKTELEGGLIVEDMKLGEGYEVKAGGAVVAHYHGTLKEGGKIFDSSFERGEPIAFPLGGVIAGWQKGVPGMKVGGIRRLTIPSALGYGERGAGADIPPNSDLVFVIELVDALQVEDVTVGEGTAASDNCVVVTAYSIKDADGKEVESTDKEHPFIWIPGEFQAIQYGVSGMKIGGKRKLIVPKELNVSPPQAESKRPQNVPVTVEIELLAVKNLPARR
jgi:FKBP-type peptidyl-prolyl cis-trans isomerase